MPEKRRMEISEHPTPQFPEQGTYGMVFGESQVMRKRRAAQQAKPQQTTKRRPPVMPPQSNRAIREITFWDYEAHTSKTIREKLAPFMYKQVICTRFMGSPSIHRGRLEERARDGESHVVVTTPASKVPIEEIILRNGYSRIVFSLAK